MLQSEYQHELDLIRSLRRQGVLTPQEAYERHMSLIASYSRAQAQSTAVGPSWQSREVAAAQTAVSGKTGFNWQIWAVLVAMVGGAFGIPGAFLQELYAGGGILIAFTGAPIIEEALKPTGVYILLLRWPQLVTSRTHTAVLAAIGGLCFGLIESLIYVTLYFPEGSSDFVLFRFTVPLVMHCTGSFLVGLGLSRRTLDWAAGRGPMPKRTRNFYLAAVALHASYNLVAVVLDISGVLSFD